MAETTKPERGALEEFRSEAVAWWGQMPNKPVFCALLAAWAMLFHFLGNSVFGYIETASLFRWMAHIFSTSPDDEHGGLIPFVVLGILWWKRHELMALPKQMWMPGIALIAAGLVIHVLGYLVQFPQVSIVGFFVGLYGLTGFVWGPQWLRATFFPMILFVFCVPLGTMGEFLTFPLRILVTKLAVGTANYGLGIDVIRDGSQIFDAQRTFQYDVAPACSGIRSLMSLLALTTVYGFITFQSLWKRLLMVVMAVPLAVAGNVVRITGVIIAGEAFGHDAGAFVEQKLGFVTFAVAIGCTLLLGFLLREARQPKLEGTVS
jgi:exosortase